MHCLWDLSASALMGKGDFPCLLGYFVDLAKSCFYFRLVICFELLNIVILFSFDFIIIGYLVFFEKKKNLDIRCSLFYSFKYLPYFRAIKDDRSLKIVVLLF